MNKHINRKELASQLGVSTKTLMRNEKKWGLDKERIALSSHNVIYPINSAEKVFRRQRGK